MGKGRPEKQNHTKAPIGVIVIALLALILIVLLLQNCSSGPGTTNYQPTQETTVQKNHDSISIPGYEALELTADRKQQTICLSNPVQNNCYFEISLYLEDGTLLWKSEPIEPGEATKPLVLTRELSKGYYSGAVLRYNCYRMDRDRTPLNGAETKVTLWVK